ncbi:unnamed protein product [Sphagnum balticum]
MFSQFRQGFNPGSQRGRGQQANMKDFESIFEDLFGGGFSNDRKKKGSSDENAEDINIKMDIDFLEAVNGATKVQIWRIRPSKSIENAPAISAKDHAPNQAQNHRSATLAKGLDL